MNQHLTAEQICRWMAGDGAKQDEQHLRQCAQCAAELARLEEVVAQFRTSIRGWSSQQRGAAVPSGWPPEGMRRSPRPQPFRWALAAALLILAAVPIYKNARDRQREEMARADALLLEQVDAAVAQPVPPSMEPLMQLVWGPSLAGSPKSTDPKENGR
jgi:hypothetical protein